jgi:hypothetical protein
MSADSETASYTSATALSDGERQPCLIADGACMTRGALTTELRPPGGCRSRFLRARSRQLDSSYPMRQMRMSGTRVNHRRMRLRIELPSSPSWSATRAAHERMLAGMKE